MPGTSPLPSPGKHHLDDDLVFLWLLAGMPVLIVSVIWGINELMAWMNGK